MRSDSDLHEPRTNAEQSETGDEFRVSYESRRKRHLLFWDVSPEGRPTIISLNPDGMSDEEYLARVHQSADEIEDEGYCYFVGGVDGPVKIGHAKNLKKRLMALQNGSPVRLSVLTATSGGLTRETAYHFQFAHCRLHGEWFERSPEILAEIERLNALSPNSDRDCNG